MEKSQLESQSQSFNNKTLYICFSGFPNGYAIRSFPMNSLVDHHRTPPLLKEVFSYPDASPLDMGEGCVILKSKVYFVVGEFVVVYNIADASISYLPPMICPCPKPNPFVFAVGESIYVLADPSFEVFNLSTTKNDWEELPLPPVFDQESEYWVPSGEDIGCAVIDRSICVSTSVASFEFNLDKKIWEPCMLFQGPRDSSHPWTLVDDYGRKHSTPCGPPFPFEGRAVLFGNDTLICMSSNNAVIAYKMVGDKIVKSQSFRSQGLRGPQAASFIARVGDCGGFFCMFVLQDVEYDTYFFTVRLFRLIKKNYEEDEEEFLVCEVVNEFDYEHKYEVSQEWFPICCFVQ